MPLLSLLASFALDGLRVLLLVASCLGPGLALVGKLPGLGSSERRVLALIAGLAALGTLLGLLALAGGFDRPRVLAVLVLAQAAWYPVLRRPRLEAEVPVHEPLDSRFRGNDQPGAGEGFLPFHPGSSRPSCASGNPFLTGALPWLGALPVVLLLAAYPPAAFDDTMYHLPLAESLVAHGGPIFEPHLRFPVFPLFQEILMAVLLALGGGETSVHLLSTAQLLLLAAVVTLWARRHAGAQSAALATALLLGCPLLVWLGSTAYVDLALALFVAGAFWALDLARTNRGGRHEASLAGWLALAGGLAGAAAAVKYHGLFFLGMVVLLGAWSAWRERRPAAAAALAAAALLTACPWYLRNALATGNPVFPFLGAVFGNSPWSAPAGLVDGLHGPQGWSLAEPTWPGWGPALRGLTTLAWDLLRSPLLLLEDSLRPRSVPPLSPFAALLLPVAAALGLARRETRRLAAPACIYLTLWLAHVRDARYLAPAAALMAVLAAPALARVAVTASGWAARWTPRRLRSVLVLLIAVLLAPAWAFGALRVAKRGLPPASEAARQRYLDRWLPGHALLACAGRTLGPGITVYGIGTEQLQHYSPGRLLGDWNGPYRFARVAPLLGDPAALAAELRAMDAELLLAPAGSIGGAQPESAGTSGALRLLSRCRGYELWEVGTTTIAAARLDCGC